jgi:uncharacterized protein (DUF58 family)
VSTRTTTLDERYGRTPSRVRRGRIGLIAGAAVLAAIVVAWLVWTHAGGAANSLTVTTTGTSIQGASGTEVRWQVTGRADARLVCVIEAQDDTGIVVGLAEVVVPVDGSANRSGTTLVRTVRLAASGLIDSCRDA